MDKFIEKFRIGELAILEIGNWVLSVRPQQITLGCLVLSLSRQCEDIGDLTETESLELGIIFNRVKVLFGATFKPNKVNYLLLMMVDNQVHFHVIPRYKDKVVFMNEEFSDVDWPKPSNIFNSKELVDEQLIHLRDYLATNI